MSRRLLHMKVNGEKVEVEVEAAETLLDVLRGRLGSMGTKKGCEQGDCGSCTVILGGKAVNSCLVLALQAEGKDVLTIEGLGTRESLHPLQQAFIDSGAVQCGFCTPGMLLTAKSLLDKNPQPSREEIKVAISGNLCRCTGYQQIIEAIEAASRTLYKGGLDG